jgi:hypothetical protein
MSEQSGEYGSSEYEGSEYEGSEYTDGNSEGGDWIAGSTIEARATDLQMFSGSIDVDTSGLPEAPDGDGDDNGDYVA